MCKDDPRFNSIESKAEKDILFYKKVQPLKEAFNLIFDIAKDDFLDLVSENKTITHTSRWSKVKKLFENDPRYGKEILSSKDRENFFYSHVNILKQEYEEEQKKLDKQKRVEKYQKERKKEIDLQREKSLSMLNREKKKAGYESEKISFTVLVTEFVSSNNISYREFKKVMRDKKEPRFDTKYMADEEKEEIFNQRMEEIISTKEREFEKLLYNTTIIDLNSEWEEIEELIWDEPEYFMIEPTSYKMELFEKYIAKLRDTAEKEYWDMLRDFPRIQPNCDRKSDEFVVIESLLRGDQRWKNLDALPGRRLELYDEFIHRLNTNPDSVRGKKRDELGRDRSTGKK
jgi:hypothetical protein